jgi:serine protease Do
MRQTLAVALLLVFVMSGFAHSQTRDEKVLADRKKVEAEGRWIYGDLAKGFAAAKISGKPILIVLRCIPCEECVKLDDELINENERIKELLPQFECVRAISTNGLELSLFQFDYDQSFAVFMLNADGTIYGRFGTRSDRTAWIGDVSVEGLAKALEGALELHQQYPKIKPLLAGKLGPKPAFSTPEKYPALQGKYGPAINYEANVAQSCIHCHQVGDAQKQYYRSRKEPLPDQVLFPYPHPKSLGLILDPEEMATVKSVEENSLAAKAGFQPGDAIGLLDKQPLLSIADVQWVLQQADSAGDSLPAAVSRDGKQVNLTLELPAGWRELDNISWRASSWGLRRMATGGLLLESLSAEDQKSAGLPDSPRRLRVKHVGQYGPHAAAKQAGFQVGDIILSFGERTDLERETDLLVYALRNFKPGEQVPVTVLRAGKEVKLTLPMQE